MTSKASNIVDSRDAAESAGLIYVSDDRPGISRRAAGKGFSYRDAKGARVTDRKTLDRIRSLGIPPAYRDVWICASPRGHIQATGRDAKGRKQYRYHARFREVRDSAKYEHMLEFGRVLPTVRARVEADMRKRGMPREKVLATVVWLLEHTMIRVGNADYARQNKSHGLTTLRDKHVKIEGGQVRFRFTGKSGKAWDLGFTNRRVARIVRASQDLPGQHLFQYLDDEGVARPVTSSDVNEYIKAAMGGEYSAKHFRTWGASVMAFEALATAKHDISLKTMLEPVTEALGNTPAIARKSYVHPRLIALVKEGQAAWRAGLKLPRSKQHLTRYERGLIAMLEEPAVELAKAA